MKQLMLLLSVTVIAILLNACETRYGSGNIITVQKSVPEFTGVGISGNIETELRRGPQKVVIEADDNLMKFISAEVEGGKLKISTEIKSLRDAHIKAYITAPLIERVSASASAEVAIKDVLSSPQLIRLSTSSGGEIEGEVDAPEVELHASSGSEMRITGRTRTLDVESSSGAEVEAFGLLSETTRVSASSGSSAKVHASISLEAAASSGAAVTYRDGGKADIKESSGGNIKRRN